MAASSSEGDAPGKSERQREPLGFAGLLRKHPADGESQGSHGPRPGRQPLIGVGCGQRHPGLDVQMQRLGATIGQGAREVHWVSPGVEHRRAHGDDEIGILERIGGQARRSENAPRRRHLDGDAVVHQRQSAARAECGRTLPGEPRRHRVGARHQEQIVRRFARSDERGRALESRVPARFGATDERRPVAVGIVVLLKRRLAESAQTAPARRVGGLTFDLLGLGAGDPHLSSTTARALAARPRLPAVTHRLTAHRLIEVHELPLAAPGQQRDRGAGTGTLEEVASLHGR